MERIEAIEILKELADCNYIGSLSGEDIESLENAVETMRKYQQIEQIVTEWNEYRQCISCGFGDFVYMQMVGKVVENGNNNQHN